MRSGTLAGMKLLCRIFGRKKREDCQFTVVVRGAASYKAVVPKEMPRPPIKIIKVGGW